MIRWWQFKKRYHCPHVNLYGVYGDMIMHLGYYRNVCFDCGKLLDGPVKISILRKAEAAALALDNDLD